MQGEGYTSDTILNADAADNESGLLKCLFILHTRELVCKTLMVESMNELKKSLCVDEEPEGQGQETDDAKELKITCAKS